jgi:twitching motility protein PilT
MEAAGVEEVPADALFGRLAVHLKWISMEQLVEAISEQGRRPGVRLGEIFVENGLLDESQIGELLSRQQAMLARRVDPKPSVEPAKPAITSEKFVAPLPTARVEGSSGWETRSGTFDAIAPPTWLEKVLAEAVRVGASDVHVHSGTKLRIRHNGALVELGARPLLPIETHIAIHRMLDDAQKSELEVRGQLDFAHHAPGVGRFRANVYRQTHGLDGVFRVVPAKPPTLSSLNLPPALRKLTAIHQGIVLVTGPAGCGKSSTMAALVDAINEDRGDHILMIEDPIEFLHTSKRSVVNQRQAGKHTGSFARALTAALREDPDVIVVGEMRDLETIQLALTAAETGHLVLSTLHTNSAARTVNRLLATFPPAQQAQIRVMMSESLRAVVSQRLVLRKDGRGRVPALEIMHVNPAVGNMIRENRTPQLRSVLQTHGTSGCARWRCRSWTS